MKLECQEEIWRKNYWKGIAHIRDDEYDVNEEMILQDDEEDDNIDLEYGYEVDLAR